MIIVVILSIILCGCGVVTLTCGIKIILEAIR